jgi:chemotaxis protein methyltransferase CheR
MNARSTTDVERFRGLLEQHLGIAFDSTKLPLLETLLQQRCRARKLDAVAFLARMERDPEPELECLAPELTVGETYFFRNHEQFKALAEIVLPARARAGRPLNVLSAGCSSGEEPYTIAIVARAAGLQAQVSIRGVDVNPEALRRAARARFSPWALRETAPDVQRAWFRPDGRELVLDESVRTSVQFEQRNLVADDPGVWTPGAYDVVFCRNVLMYFAPETMARVVERIALALRPGGYLFLGHAETLRGLSSAFHLRHTHGTFYYQRREDGSPATTGAEFIAPPATVSALASVVGGSESWIEAIQRASERIRSLASTERASDPRVAAEGPDLRPALALLEDERYGDALALVEGVPAGAASDPDAQLLRAVLLTHVGRLGDAEQACHRLLAIDELNSGAHYVLALCRESSGDLAGAREHDHLALHLDPTFAMARLHLGLLAQRGGDREAAHDELRQAVLLLQREDAARLLLFGGGFQRSALVALCKAQLGALA